RPAPRAGRRGAARRRGPVRRRAGVPRPAARRRPAGGVAAPRRLPGRLPLPRPGAPGARRAARRGRRRPDRDRRRAVGGLAAREPRGRVARSGPVREALPMMPCLRSVAGAAFAGAVFGATIPLAGQGQPYAFVERAPRTPLEALVDE